MSLEQKTILARLQTYVRTKACAGANAFFLRHNIFRRLRHLSSVMHIAGPKGPLSGRAVCLEAL